MPNGTYGGVRGRKTKVGRKLLRFPPTRLYPDLSYSADCIISLKSIRIWMSFCIFAHLTQ